MTFNAGIEAAALLPCPFCDGEAVIEQKGSTRQSNIVACTECGCRLESGDVFDPAGSWNTRPSSSAPVEQRDEIESRLASSMNDVLCKMIDNKDEMVTTVITAKVIASKPFQEIIDRLSLPGSSRDEAYAQGVADADQLIGCLWVDLFNKDLVKASGADYFDKWRDRIRALKSGVAK